MAGLDFHNPPGNKKFIFIPPLRIHRLGNTAQARIWFATREVAGDLLF
jgi:hypothetical protein